MSAQARESDFKEDARGRLTIVADERDEHRLLGLLRKADRSFSPVADDIFRAVNDAGFIVDCVISEHRLDDREDGGFGQDELAAGQIPDLPWLMNAPASDVVTITANGRAVMMRVPDPRAFALHKAWLPSLPDRDPSTKTGDCDLHPTF